MTLNGPERSDLGAVNATYAATLVDEWARAGITDAVVSPGSRSTPMALALAGDGRIAVHIHHDERAAAFIALGLGLSTGRPAIVLTTSGTAAVELHPAIVEAHQAGVPVIAVTADRPPELHDVGAPQTVDQTRLYGGAVRWFAEPGPPTLEAAGSWRSLASRAVLEATNAAGGPGPVHLNLAFREPLVGSAAPLPEGRPDGRPWHVASGSRHVLDRSAQETLADVACVERGVIVAGAGCGPVEAVIELAEAAGWPVLADARSGCRVDHRAVVTHADAILRHGPTAGYLRPEVVLRLGAPPASKVVAGWLAASGALQVAVDAYGRWFDADRTAAVHVAADPTAVLASLSCQVERGSGGHWSSIWRDAEAVAATAIAEAISAEASSAEAGHARSGHAESGHTGSAGSGHAGAIADESEHAGPGHTEPGVARELLGVLRPGATLVVSSSMPVRDVEWYGGSAPGVRVLANRGANGIDGVVSTAVGAALAARGTGEATVALVGDVAFLHDANALLGLAARGIDLTVVVVDNDGGGIFSFLPQAHALSADRFEVLFGTPHGVSIPTLVAAHGLVTIEPTGPTEFARAVAASVAAGGVAVVRVVTDRTTNVAVHDRIHAAVGVALDGVSRAEPGEAADAAGGALGFGGPGGG